MKRRWTLGVLALGLMIARCDFGIDTTGLAGDGQAPDDATSEAAPQDGSDEATIPDDGGTESAPPVDASDETTPVDAASDAPTE
ncbi:MAG TPA: hypothetical protein VGH28_16920 [Polyangiaceae bacterium]|jgi:hypothetical protein